MVFLERVKGLVDPLRRCNSCKLSSPPTLIAKMRPAWQQTLLWTVTTESSCSIPQGKDASAGDFLDPDTGGHTGFLYGPVECHMVMTLHP